MAMGYALNGGRPCGIDVHEMLYHAACGSPLGFALCDAAGFAFLTGSKFFPVFTVATHLPGFLRAMEVWAKHFEYDQAFECRARFEFVLREVVGKKAPGSDFWFLAVQPGFADTLEFWDAGTVENKKWKDATRKMIERDSKRSPAKYKQRVEGGWLPLSLWARTAKDIAYLLEPDLKDAGKDVVETDIGRVAGDISDFHGNVKMPSSHCGRKYGGIIECAERAVQKIP